MHLGSSTPKPLIHFGLIVFLALLCLPAHGAKIIKSKGKSVMIDLEGENFKKGDSFFAVVDGKKRGVIVLSNIKGGRAVGRIAKGSVSNNAILQPRGAATSKTKARSSGRSSSLPKFLNNLAVGGLVGYSMVSQDVKMVSGNTTSMADSGIGIKALGELPIMDNIGLLVRLGMESFKTTGTAKTVSDCAPSGQCSTEISYFTSDVLLKYTLPLGTFHPFAGLGIGIFYPVSKTSNALDDTKISATSVLMATLGTNVNLTPTLFVPVHADYAMFPSSSDVSTSMMVLRAGLGMRF